MSNRDTSYRPDHDDSNWHRIERCRERQRCRMLLIDAADGYLELARELVAPPHRDTRYAVRVLMKAVDGFQEAGLSRRARVVWRYARLLHEAATREAMQ